MGLRVARVLHRPGDVARPLVIVGTALLAFWAQGMVRTGGLPVAAGGPPAPVPCATTFDTTIEADAMIDEIRVAVDDTSAGVSTVEVRGETGFRALHAQAGGRRLTFEPALAAGTLDVSGRVADDALAGACVTEVSLWSHGVLVGRAAPR